MLQPCAPRVAPKERMERKKVPLKPGHSLMDWLNLCRANKNMSGRTVQGAPVTMAELRQHKTVETGIWTALKGNVYNITPYIEFHPGGVEKIMMAAGRDCTMLFDKYHSWVNYQVFLASCLIGPLVPEPDSVPAGEAEGAEKAAGDE